MKTKELIPANANQSKAFFIITVSFVASLMLSMAMVGLAVNWILHNS